MSLNFEASTAGCFADFVGADSEVEWALSSIAQIEIRQPKSPNETQRLILPRKPRGPNLNRHPARMVRTAAASRIHQQISEPPRSAAIRQSHTNKPDFVTSLARETGISLIESVHAYIILGPGQGSELSSSGTRLLSPGELQVLRMLAQAHTCAHRRVKRLRIIFGSLVPPHEPGSPRAPGHRWQRSPHTRARRGWIHPSQFLPSSR